MLQPRSICAVTTSVVLLIALANPVPGATWQSKTIPSGQTAASAASGQSAAGTTTTYEPQYKVEYETVYDTESYQVPVTRMRLVTGPSIGPGLSRLRDGWTSRCR